MTRQEHLLICLAEECSEVQKEISKILRFGIEDAPFESPRSGKDLKPNRERLQNELTDVFAIIEMLDKEGIHTKLDRRAIEAKITKVEYYIQYAKDKGLVTK